MFQYLCTLIFQWKLIFLHWVGIRRVLIKEMLRLTRINYAKDRYEE